MPKLESGLDVEVADTEWIARFVYNSGDKNSAGAKPSAFMPANGEVSVCRHGLTPEEELKRFGATYRTDKQPKGAALILVCQVRATRLDVLSSEPPPRHANVIGWSNHPDEVFRKSEDKLAALELAQVAEWIGF